MNNYFSSTSVSLYRALCVKDINIHVVLKLNYGHEHKVLFSELGHYRNFKYFAITTPFNEIKKSIKSIKSLYVYYTSNRVTRNNWGQFSCLFRKKLRHKSGEPLPDFRPSSVLVCMYVQWSIPWSNIKYIKHNKYNII